ncbi:hypothetical protein [Thalassobacillus pellis]|uniref:hypothetical protein n=1 Tax=Thalassobacillus pellis TaxID=748008 RepID=UPI0019612D60|nr:hypothetical protein [Thalassobacillus pellis]MBM7552630.1 ElaB/YqjD/DUF883 family membrane-anchored ribosome-binding protein [Thalassobacillus pellis]
MSYHQNKQEAFQHASNKVNEAERSSERVLSSIGEADYGRELAHLKEEINQAYQQVEKALTVASEHQEEQLISYKNQLDKIMNHIQ